MLDGFQDGRLGDFVEDNAAGMLRRQSERFGQVPGNGLSFTVFIGSQPHCSGLGGRCSQFRHRLLLVGGNFVLRQEAVFDIDAQALFLQVPDVSEA